jgi:hypothetical protein
VGVEMKDKKILIKAACEYCPKVTTHAEMKECFMMIADNPDMECPFFEDKMEAIEVAETVLVNRRTFTKLIHLVEKSAQSFCTMTKEDGTGELYIDNDIVFKTKGLK